MTRDGRTDTALREEQSAQTRLAIGALIVPIFFVVMFSVCIIGTYHKPHPNGIKVGVVGPAAVTAPLRAGLTKAAGSEFDIREAPSVPAAAHDVRQRDLDAAYVPSAGPKQPATVIVASGGGRLVATAAETLARSAAAVQGAQLVVRDVRPLAAGDEIGIGVFMFMIVCTICGYLAATLLETVAPALLPRRRYAMIAAIAVLVPLLAYLIGGVGLGTYDGSFGTILVFLGIGAFYTLVIGLGTRLFQVLLGPAGLFVALVVFIFLNIPSLGATYTSTMLTPFWRAVNHVWIGAAAVNAERSVLYFGWLDLATDLLILLIWAGVIVALLLLPVSRRLESRRERTAALGARMPSTGILADEA